MSNRNSVFRHKHYWAPAIYCVHEALPTVLITPKVGKVALQFVNYTVSAVLRKIPVL